MAHEIACPSCGRTNPVDALECANCNFPLAHAPELVAASKSESATEPAQPTADAPSSSATEREIALRSLRPIRPRRPGGPDQKLQMQLWLVLGGLSVLFILYTAVDGFKKNAKPQVQVEGAKEDQQHAADLARKALEADSTNLQARIALADVLYDTANWSEAVIHYKSAIRQDPNRVTSYVDMGVCYYNLSRMDDAVGLFKKALTLDPKQPVALFNLGIVAESRSEYDAALKYYHQAMQANPPDQMGQVLIEAIQRIMKKQGRQAPPLPGMGGEAPPTGK